MNEELLNYSVESNKIVAVLDLEVIPRCKGYNLHRKCETIHHNHDHHHFSPEDR